MSPPVAWEICGILWRGSKLNHNLRRMTGKTANTSIALNSGGEQANRPPLPWENY